MRATETLMQEHQVILLVLRAGEAEIERMRDTGRVDAERVAKMVDFIRNFADRCHHAKEEDLLFVRLHEQGMSRESGPLGVMLAEHTEARRLVKGLADALLPAADGDSAALAVVRDNLAAYVELLRSHIDKEDNVLYPMADRLLAREVQQQLAEAFERVEAEEMGAGVHERYHALAHELAGRDG